MLRHKAALAQLLDAAAQLYEHSQRPGQLCPCPLTPMQAIAQAGEGFPVILAPHAIRLWQLANAAWQRQGIAPTSTDAFRALVSSLRIQRS